MTIERRQRLLMAMFGCLTIAGLLLSQPSVSVLCWASGWLWAVSSDLRRREIPDMAWVLCLAAVLPAGGRALHWQNALPGLLPGVLFLLLTVAGAFEMGGGDIKLILAGGAVLGLFGTVLAVTIAFALLLGYTLIKGRRAPVGKLPLAPFLYAGFFPLGVLGVFAG